MDRVLARTRILTDHMMARRPAALGASAIAAMTASNAAVASVSTSAGTGSVRHSSTAAAAAKNLVNDKDAFLEVYHTLSREIVEELKEYEMPLSARTYVRRLMDHTVLGGKMNRGLTVAASYQALIQRDLTEDEYFKAAALGWCIEWLQAFFLVADDIMDDSITRRGLPCWYREPDVGLDAINDSIVLESGIHRILRRHFKSAPYYLDLLELFHDVTYRTELGQLLDTKTAPPGDVDLSRFSIEQHALIVKYKTAYYSFYIPVALAFIMAGIKEEKLFKTAEDILVDMGTYFQVQDDYLDCYADPEVLGKIGTDIQDNKCSWLVVQALDRCTPAQRQILEENYGQKDEDKIEAVKELYRELDLEAVYHAYEDKALGELHAAIAAVTDVPQEVFTNLLNKIARRSK